MQMDDAERESYSAATESGGPSDPYLTVEQAARRLKIKRDTLDRWRMEGRGPIFRYHGGRVVYRIDDIDAWSDEQKHTRSRRYNRDGASSEDDGGAS